MSELISEKTCIEFTEMLSSKAAVPGGGGAAALCGALAASLCSMAGNLTLGRKKYAQYEADLVRMLADCEKLRASFLELIDKDAEAFGPLSKAYSLPKDAPDYDEIMKTATINACSAPLEMMRLCAQTVELLEEMAEKCSRLLISDAGCGALFASSALRAASMNVFVNTRLLRGDKQAEEISAEAEKLLDEYVQRAEAVAEKVMSFLKS